MYINLFQNQLRSASKICVGAIFLSAATMASAGILSFTGFALDNPSSSAQEGWAWTNNTVGGVSENPKTGQWKLDWNGKMYDTFCIEPLQGLKFNQPYYQYSWSNLQSSPGDLSDLQLDRINKLYEASYDQSRTSGDLSASFQLAMWEILYDSSLDLNTGTFQTISDGGIQDTSAYILNAATSMLAGLDSKSVGDWNFYRLSNATIQDQIIGERVPVPTTVSLMLLALGVMGASKATQTQKTRETKV